MNSQKLFGAVCFTLFVLLAVILWPTFNSFNSFWDYARSTGYGGITLWQVFQAEMLLVLMVWGVFLSNAGKRSSDLIGYIAVRRHLVLLSLIGAQVLVSSFAGGFLAHQDTAWYQVLHESKDIMPAHAIIILTCYPLYLLFGSSAYLFAASNLEKFSEDKKAAFLVLTFAPFVYLPYYDASFLDPDSFGSDFLYAGSYWILSIGWLIYGVFYLLLTSAREIFKGLSNPMTKFD